MKHVSMLNVRWPWALIACVLVLLTGGVGVASGHRYVNATSPATVAESSGKVGVASAKYLSADEQRLSGVGASWAYDWSATAPVRDSRLAWVPMVWGSGSVTPQVIASLRADKRDGTARDLLGFNEPDSGSQANMTPVQAADLWPQLERTRLLLGSPAPAVPTDGWLARFMTLSRQRHLRVDFIALHYYQDFTDPNAVAELRSQLTAIHRAYGKPVWITEIGAIDIRSWGETMLHTPTTARAVSYMRRLFRMLDALPFVQRYAWFTDDCWNDSACRYGSLFNGSGVVTPLGRTFARLAASPSAPGLVP